MQEVSISQPLRPRFVLDRYPVASLFLATLFWGMGFAWAKAGGETINARAGRPPGAMLGPVLLLGVRFSIGGILWLSVFPQARAGWSWRNVRVAAMTGFVLGVGLISQHLGLDRTSEAVSAFLTNLTVIFVPLLVALIERKRPPRRLVLPIVIAAAGIYLMTGAAASGIGAGELLGLLCAIFFSLYIVLVDFFQDEPFRSTGIQFAVVGVMCILLSCILVRGEPGLGLFLTDRILLREAVLLILLTTVGAFGLMMRYQPRINPTRAALIYLAEPIFAAAWAWMVAGRAVGLMTAIGAGLIICANVLAGKKPPQDSGANVSLAGELHP